MTGLEKIINKIEADCSAECDVILSAANAEAKAILKKAAEDLRIITQDITDAALKENEKEKTFVSSKTELDRKKGVLAEKIAIVNSVIAAALKKLTELPDEEYFKTITALVQKYAQAGEGTLCFSASDIARLPNGFEAELNKILAGGRTVIISGKPVNIEGGFILVYEDVEQNCSFGSLLATQIDDIKDELYAKMFKRDNL